MISELFLKPSLLAKPTKSVRRLQHDSRFILTDDFDK
jgi:hypothetical protein